MVHSTLSVECNISVFSPRGYIRLVFSRLRSPRNASRSAVRSLNSTPKFHQHQRFPYYVLPTLGVSFFSWIGFDKETTHEEDLIMSIKQSILLIQRSELVKAEQLLHVALRQAQQMYNEMGITYIYDVMANLALQREQLDKAKTLFISVSQRLMQKGVTEDDLRIVHISLKLARISHLSKDYKVAQIGYEWCINKLNDQLKKNPSEDLTQLLAMAEDWYGHLFIDCNETERGLNLLLSAHNRSLTLSNISDDHIVIQLNDLGTVYEQLNRLEESERYLKEAVEKGKPLKDMDDFGAIYVNLGRVYLKKGMLEQARKSCGYGWRLGHDRMNEAVKKQAMECIEALKKA